MNDEIRGSKVLITVAVMLAALMAVLDISIVNVALSDIRASFGTPIDQISWISTGYMMANIVVIPMTGWLQRKFGYRRYFAVSILIFTGASTLCGLSWNLPSLVLARVLQGLGGGAIIPTSQAILFARYPREQHGMAGAMFGLGAVTGPLLGPTLGGYLIDRVSWHWIFLINVPIGLFAAALAWRVLEQPNFKPTRDRIDKWGIALLAVGMATLVYVLEEGNREGWLDSTTVTALAAVSIIALVTFVVHELEQEHPVVDLRIFKNRSYAATTGINFLTGTCLFSSMFLYSLYCGAVMHYTALDIGLLFLKGSCIQLLVMPLVGRFGGKIDGRWLIAWGVAMMCFSLWTNAHLSAVGAGALRPAAREARQRRRSVQPDPRARRLHRHGVHELPARPPQQGLLQLPRRAGERLGRQHPRPAAGDVREPGRPRPRSTEQRAGRAVEPRQPAGPGARLRRRLH